MKIGFDGRLVLHNELDITPDDVDTLLEVGYRRDNGLGDGPSEEQRDEGKWNCVLYHPDHWEPWASSRSIVGYNVIISEHGFRAVSEAAMTYASSLPE